MVNHTGPYRFLKQVFVEFPDVINLMVLKWDSQTYNLSFNIHNETLS